MANPSQFLAIWSAAKKRYAEVTGEDMDGDAFPHPSSIHHLQTSLDNQNDKFGDFRKKRASVFHVLEGVCKPIELVSSMAGGAASMAFPPSTLCFGAITYLINAAKGVSASYDAIIDMMGTLKDFLVRLAVYDREQLPIELQEKLAEILATLLEVFARSAKVVRRGLGGRFLSMGKNVLLGNDEKLGELVSRLDKMTLGESRLVGAETLTESKRTGSKVDDISATLIETNITISEGNHKIGELNANVLNVRENVGIMMAALKESRPEANEGRDRKHVDQAKRILNPSPNPEDIYTAIDRTRLPKTGDWIRNEEPFQAWMNQDSPILWISGMPGSGKTYLSGNIISYLAQEHPQRVQHASHTSIGYFFFKDNDPRTRSFNQALNDLAFQVSLNDPIYAHYIASNFQSAAEIETLPSKWRRLFVEYFLMKEKVDSKVYLVLDGVDEALDSERREFLDLLVDLKEATRSTFRTSSINLIMVGRPQIINDINEALEGSIPTIFVDWCKNNQDIINYVRASIKKSKALRATPKDLQEEIVETMARDANGMFLWVALLMRELSKISHVGTLRKRLHQAPKGLWKMLRHVLEGVSASLADSEEDATDLNLLLMWVTCAETPLSLGQLDTILKLHLPEGDGVLRLESKLRMQYASFFTLLREDGFSTAELQRGELALEYNEENSQANEGEGLEDIENDSNFNSNPDTTDVMFYHASIADFFRDKSEGKARSGPEYPEIGVNIVEARICTLITCLNLICDPSLAKKVEDSAFSVMLILDDVVLTHKIEVGNLLVEMLRNEAVAVDWAREKDCLFFNLDSLQPIRAWLEHPDVLDQLADSDRQWVQSAKRNPGEYYFAAAKGLATRWLTSKWAVRDDTVLAIHGVVNLLHGSGDDNIPNTFETVPISVILAAAEWPQFEKTALWHTNLAVCLQENEYYDEAMEHFQVALDIDPGAMNNLWMQDCKRYVVRRYSRYCLEKARKFESAAPEAMQWVEKLEKLCKAKNKATDDAPEIITTNSSALFLGIWYRENGRGDEAIACFQPFILEALMILSDDDPDNDDHGFNRLADALTAAGDDENAVAALQSLQPRAIDKNHKSEIASVNGETDGKGSEENDKVDDAGGDHADREGARAEHESNTDEDLENTDPDEASPNHQSANNGVSRDKFPLSELMSRFAKAWPREEHEWPWECCGPCGRSFPIYAEANLCRVCLSDICDDCLRLIRSGDQRAQRECKSTHSWLHVDAPEQEVAKGQILVGGKAIPFEDFLERLRLQWKV